MNATKDAAATGLRFDRITKEYGQGFSLGPVSARLRFGELVSLRGPNGSGKTTLLRLAAGLAEPTKGRITIDGFIAGSLGARRLVSFVPDGPIFYSDISVGEHIEFVCGLHGVDPRSQEVAQTTAELGVTPLREHLPSRLSKGQQQRCFIALALVRPFSVLLLDEPFTGLDREGKLTLSTLIDSNRAQGKLIVAATHDPDLLLEVDRAIVLDDGRVVDA
jgi:ABC-type multidrug transport system ATPase subunit